MTQPVTIQTRTITGTASPSGGGGRLLITGGVHGDEFEPMAAIRRLIHTIDAAHLRGSVTLAPLVNASAFARGHRTADDHLDLARACPGDPLGSITQRTAHALASLIRAADYYIDLHTGGTTLSVFPLAGYMLHADPKVLDTQRLMARAFNLPIVWGTSAQLEGRSLSVARDASVPAIYTEYHGAAVCDPAGVDAYVDGCLNVMAALGMIDRPPQSSRVWHVVEDDRPASGHMQRCNPSPADGYFEAAVRLGDTVHAGQPLGWVTDALGTHRHDVRAHESGIVLTLRTFPCVHKGDSLAVILDTTRGGAHV